MVRSRPGDADSGDSPRRRRPTDERVIVRPLRPGDRDRLAPMLGPDDADDLAPAVATGDGTDAPPGEPVALVALLADAVTSERTNDPGETTPDDADGPADGALVGMVQVAILPGRVASVRLPRVGNLPPGPLTTDAVVGRLTDAVADLCRSAGVAIAYASEPAPPDGDEDPAGLSDEEPFATDSPGGAALAPVDEEALAGTGWRAVATLLVCVWWPDHADLGLPGPGDDADVPTLARRTAADGADRGTTDDEAPPGTASEGPTPVLVAVREGTPDEAVLAGVVTASYVGSSDCPALDGLRDVGDVLDGYRAMGRPRADRWWLLRADGAAVGCLILADHEARGAAELVYLGLVPAVRGRRWGRALMAAAQSITAAWGRSVLTATVDADNPHAQAGYAAQGFVGLLRRRLWLWTDEDETGRGARE